MEKKRKQNSKSSTSKTKTSSGNRSLSKSGLVDHSKSVNGKRHKIYSPHTTRKENIPFEYKFSSKDKNNRKEFKKLCLSSSKISCWVDAKNTCANSELNSNLYRNVENPESYSTYKSKQKSSRSHVTNSKRKKKKHHVSTGQSLEKQRTIDTAKGTFAQQLISLIHQMHSPSS